MGSEPEEPPPSAFLYKMKIETPRGFRLCERKKMDFVIFIGGNEIKKKVLKLRNMKTGKELELNSEKLIKIL